MVSCKRKCPVDDEDEEGAQNLLYRAGATKTEWDNGTMLDNF